MLRREALGTYEGDIPGSRFPLSLWQSTPVHPRHLTLKSRQRFFIKELESGVGTAWHPECGAWVSGDEVEFRLWAPNSEHVQLLVYNDKGEKRVHMANEDGTHRVVVHKDGNLIYSYVLDGGKVRPDPASLCQPRGVHGPSRVVDVGRFRWNDKGWKGVPLDDLVIYELHIGTYAPDGTFDSLTLALPRLVELGVTTLELMPVAQFPGGRNWGYDAVYPYAVQNSYGGPEAFARLVDRCHTLGMAVLLDVVYNHFGPEGNYFKDFGPYFSSSYKTPWGEALNYDGQGSDQVRRFVVDNALHWIRNFHLDGLRLDAIHGIIDNSPRHILQQLGDEVKAAESEMGRPIHIVAESDLNDPRVVRRREECGYGLDAQWADDVHHSFHACLTGERSGYYQDFGSLEDVAKAFVNPFVYDGRYSRYRGKTHGSSPKGIPSRRFVVFSQNHDQVGNRADGTRLRTIAGAAVGRVAAAMVLLSPYLPLLFMGEEYGETAPFLFFTDYQDKTIAEMTKEGRRRELEAQGKDFVDPQSAETFERCKLGRGLEKWGDDRETTSYYSKLISFRRSHSAIRAERSNSEVRIFAEEGAVVVRRWDLREELLLVFVTRNELARLDSLVADGNWSLELASEDGSPPEVGKGPSDFPGRSASVYEKR